MSTSAALCLITPGHVASTPRLVKNADALAAAGYRVHVVCGRHFPPADRLDSEIFTRARWTHTRVELGGAAAVPAKVLGRAARLLARAGASPAFLAARIHQPLVGALAAAAAQVPADLYFGHCLAGLPAAAGAARRCGRPYGFDAEDFHDAETAEATADPAEAAARRRIQSDLIPGCAVFTAASPLIAQAYARAYGREPLPLLNVFPLAEGPPAPAAPAPVAPGRPARLYWFSQTVGAGRGLEAMAEVIGLMRTPAELHLRGFVDAAYAAELEARAARAGAPGRIRFLAPAPSAEMARLAAGFDLGLSTEESSPPNRDLCLTNKVFVYLLAGLPQLLSDTAAQSALAPELGAAALLGRLADPAGIARRLDAFFADPAGVAAARTEAWRLARERFCWDLEQRRLLQAVAGALSR